MNGQTNNGQRSLTNKALGTSRREVQIGDKTVVIETGKMARQADGAAVVSCGGTVILAAVVGARTQDDSRGFFPLTVEYRERSAAAGRFPGGYIKRETRPGEKEILSARLIDRPVRPLFAKGYGAETQIFVTVFSSDQENDADVLGAIGASAALTISDIPFLGPIANVRVGRLDGKFIVNPTVTELEESDVDMIVGGTLDSIVMVEGEMDEISEAEMIEGIQVAHEAIKALCQAQVELRDEIGKPKREVVQKTVNQPLVDAITAFVTPKLQEAVKQTGRAKDERRSLGATMQAETVAALKEQMPEADAKEIESTAKKLIHDIEGEVMREQILADGIRLDGRKTDQIRPISCEVGVLPRTHGSALFTRGETQALVSLTLGTKKDEQDVDDVLGEYSKKFTLHYNFPPYSTGETKRLMGPSRREIGHGHLAERALKGMVPVAPMGEFPYTIRLVSDVLESNGSSSMASVCGGTLAMLDGGVPMEKPVAGIAMGLIQDGDRIAVLSDILGDEDHLGDMDFKVTGTAEGITACQMDIKVQGISGDILQRALDQAKDGRIHILGEMAKAISGPRKSLSPFAPRLIVVKVPTDMIGMIIGPGGKNIRGLIESSGVETIDIDDDGTVVIASLDAASGEMAERHIRGMIAVPEVGTIYEGEIKRITPFGAFVEIMPGKEGLMHISNIANRRLERVEEELQLGERVRVKLMKLEPGGKMDLNRKVLLEDYKAPAEGEESRERAPRRDGGGYGGRDSGGRGGDRGGPRR